MQLNGMNPRSKQVLGAGLAIALGLLAWTATIPFLPKDSWEGGIRLFATLVVAGIPVGAFLAWRFADRVARWHPVRLIA
jgi:hypothetical protein